MARSSHSGRHSATYQPSPLRIGIILVAFIVGAAVLLASQHSSSPAQAGASSTTTVVTNSSSSVPTNTVPPSQVRVEVANGTTTPHLAANFSQQLTTQGWNTMQPTNAAHTNTTTIYYQPGYQWAANQIATQIGAPTTAVTPLGNLAPVAGAMTDNVIVIIGLDLAG
jgi:uncharacterized membrane protein